jgi:hypothetical protein
VACRRMTDMGTLLADFLTRAAVAASAPAAAAASSAHVPRRWPFRRGLDATSGWRRGARIFYTGAAATI